MNTRFLKINKRTFTKYYHKTKNQLFMAGIIITLTLIIMATVIIVEAIF